MLGQRAIGEHLWTRTNIGEDDHILRVSYITLAAVIGITARAERLYTDEKFRYGRARGELIPLDRLKLDLFPLRPWRVRDVYFARLG
jgi:hypothetical protein